MILVITVGLWIFWVAPYFLRNRLQHLGAAAKLPTEGFSAVLPDPQAGAVLTMATQQETVMDIRKSTPAATGVQAAPASGAFRIRYGRCAVAATALLALLTAVVTLLMLPFGAVNGLVPAAAALLTVACVAVLRALAIRDRRVKVRKAFAAAMSGSPAAPPRRAPETRIATPAAETTAAPSAAPFDAEAGKASVKPLTSDELRAAAVAVAVAAGDATAGSAPASQPSSGTPWEPVEVPKPVYVDAAKAQRPAPEPLALPEAPKASSKTPLRQSAAAEPRTAPAAKPASALSNLDDVLQRRRA